MRAQLVNLCSHQWRLVLPLTVALAWTSLDGVRAQTAVKTGAEPWVAPERAARKLNPIPADAKSLAQGRELFIAGCVPCHGVTGRGDGPVASTLERNGVHIPPGNLADPRMWEQTDGAIFWKLAEGRSPMPSWSETLTEEQRWAIINYVRTLAPKSAGDTVATNSSTNSNSITNSSKLAVTKPENTL